MVPSTAVPVSGLWACTPTTITTIITTPITTTTIPIAVSHRYCAAVRGGVNAYTDGFMENGIGIDDFLALCKEVDLVPALTIRFQFGGPGEVQEASDWVGQSLG